MKKKPELLAPAGSWDAMVAAVQNGADAVYLGGNRFSARAGTSNFNDEMIERAIDYCHLRGVRVFVAVNTLIKQKELQDTLRYVLFLYRIGADALIVQDIGLARAVLQMVPDFPLHASTQMTVHNISGIKALEQMGFRRVVLARELTKQQILKIRQATGLEIEVFVHGALCYCFSGQCLFSSFLGGRSGNRGRCAQPCRLPYRLKKDGKQIKNGYLLSPKDLCLLAKIQEIESMGIDSLKIEGRLKRPEYVAVVTSIYRKYIDNPIKPSEDDLKKLLDAFNRSGFTQGYFSGKTGISMMSLKNPSNIAPEVFSKGVEKTFHPDANFKKIGISAKCIIAAEKPAVFEITDGDGNTVKAEGFAPKRAENLPISKDRVRSQLSKFGSTPFRLDSLTLTMEDGLTMPISEINALRRDAAQKLSAARVMKKKRTHPAELPQIVFDAPKARQTRRLKEVLFSAEVQTAQQAEAVLPYEPVRLYAPFEVVRLFEGKPLKTQLVTKLPDIIADEDAAFLKNNLSDRVMTGIFALGKELSKSHTVYGDFRLNIFNSLAGRACMDAGFEAATLSVELNLRGIAEICLDAAMEYEAVVYGHLPLMIIKNCVIKYSQGKCGKLSGSYSLLDRKNERLPLLCEPRSCVNLLLNAKPLYMADKLQDVIKSGVSVMRLNFTVEDASRCDEIMRIYTDAANGKTPPPLFEENAFTRGHFYRGVE